MLVFSSMRAMSLHFNMLFLDTTRSFLLLFIILFFYFKFYW